MSLHYISCITTGAQQINTVYRAQDDNKLSPYEKVFKDKKPRKVFHSLSVCEVSNIVSGFLKDQDIVKLHTLQYCFQTRLVLAIMGKECSNKLSEFTNSPHNGDKKRCTKALGNKIPLSCSIMAIAGQIILNDFVQRKRRT